MEGNHRGSPDIIGIPNGNRKYKHPFGPNKKVAKEL
jgi:hypothetical protein